MNGFICGAGFFRSSFDRLRTNGKILNLMAVKPELGNEHIYWNVINRGQPS